MSEDAANMKDSWFFDKSFNGLSDEIFNDLNFFDFPLEDVETNPVEEDWNAQFKRLEEPCFDVFSVSSSGLCAKTQTENPQLGRNFLASGLYDKGRRKWNGVSPLKKRAKTAGPTYGKIIPNQNVSFSRKDLHQFQTNSPVSVFENSSSSSVENTNFDLPAIPAKRARSKRRPLSSFSPVFSISFIPTSPALQKYQRTTASGSDLSLAGKSSNKAKKQRKKDLSLLSSNVQMKGSSSQESVAPRKCTHCEVKKTPQWREGPMGPKTLCNACGVRYRSGRLFPEYRPAASPTFVPSLHSNSHKKVVEMMRSKAIQE